MFVLAVCHICSKQSNKERQPLNFRFGMSAEEAKSVKLQMAEQVRVLGLRADRKLEFARDIAGFIQKQVSTRAFGRCGNLCC